MGDEPKKVNNLIGNRLRKGLGNLADKDYLGRVIIIGKDRPGDNVIVIYAISGRSSSSQARKLVQEDDAIWARPTDSEILKKGKIELLVYPAVCLSRGIAVSNGRQTLDLKTGLGRSQNPSEILRSALSRWDYEPDPPIFTPRISGCVVSSMRAALSIITRGRNGESIRNVFEFPLAAGKGKMISTYEGQKKEPLVPFSGEPLDVELNEKRPKDMAEAVYEALRPKAGGEDFRVAVASVFSTNIESKEYDLSIINRYERMRNWHGKNK